ncbi:hypothetical protein LINPERHAP2_LOCUS30807 [Linum perenne]
MAGLLPPLVPFAQAFAAAVIAALTSFLYYISSSPKDPTYVVAPVLHSRPRHTDVKRLFAGLLSFYLGYEWIQVTCSAFLAFMISLVQLSYDANTSFTIDQIALLWQTNNILVPMVLFMVQSGLYSDTYIVV